MRQNRAATERVTRSLQLAFHKQNEKKAKDGADSDAGNEEQQTSNGKGPDGNKSSWQEQSVRDYYEN